MSVSGGSEAVHCSRAGCSATAAIRVNWRNPKIHSADRVKVWFACHEHAPFLHDYLDSRGFPVALSLIGDVVDRVPDRTI